jgi:pyruvate dehydrogenase E2 component (dihydrolipoamide acetyltransferase)
MATAVIMPKIGQSVETCILTEWFKKKGDPVAVGDILFSFETDKAAMEEEAKAEGILLEIFFEAGSEIPVLTSIAVIGQPDEQIEGFRTSRDEVSSKISENPSDLRMETLNGKIEEIAGSAQKSSPGRIKISPRAKVLARMNAIDYTKIRGTGPGGRIMVKDIESYSGYPATPSGKEFEMGSSAGLTKQAGYTEAGQSGTPDFTEKEISNIRRLISASMYRSLQNSAQLTHHLSADARRLLDIRKKVKELKTGGQTPDITLNDMVCFAVIRSLKKHPEMNCHFLGDRVREFNKIHLAIAVDTPRGLMVPVLKNAGDQSIEELSVNLKNMAAQCRQGNIHPDLLSPEAASFTVSNLGAWGVEMFTPILNVPQVGIIGVNAIVLRPADIGNGIIGMVPFIGISLTYDHRAIDGGPASRFLQTVKNEIETFTNPADKY